jgi:hypothetical protein
MNETHTGAWWRWLLLPFAAVLTTTLSAAVVTLLNSMSMSYMGGSTDGWFMAYVNPIMVKGFSGYVFAKTVHEVAPSHKAVAGTVMVTLLGVSQAAVLTYAVALGAYTALELVREALAATLMVGTAICVVRDPEWTFAP